MPVSFRRWICRLFVLALVALGGERGQAQDTLTLVADTTTVAPGEGNGTFGEFGIPLVQGDIVAFTALMFNAAGIGLEEGVFVGSITGRSLVRIADTTTTGFSKLFLAPSTGNQNSVDLACSADGRDCLIGFAGEVEVLPSGTARGVFREAIRINEAGVLEFAGFREVILDTNAPFDHLLPTSISVDWAEDAINFIGFGTPENPDFVGLYRDGVGGLQVIADSDSVITPVNRAGEVIEVRDFRARMASHNGAAAVQLFTDTGVLVAGVFRETAFDGWEFFELARNGEPLEDGFIGQILDVGIAEDGVNAVVRYQHSQQQIIGQVLRLVTLPPVGGAVALQLNGEGEDDGALDIPVGEGTGSNNGADITISPDGSFALVGDPRLSVRLVDLVNRTVNAFTGGTFDPSLPVEIFEGACEACDPGTLRLLFLDPDSASDDNGMRLVQLLGVQNAYVAATRALFVSDDLTIDGIGVRTSEATPEPPESGRDVIVFDPTLGGISPFDTPVRSQPVDIIFSFDATLALPVSGTIEIGISYVDGPSSSFSDISVTSSKFGLDTIQEHAASSFAVTIQFEEIIFDPSTRIVVGMTPEQAGEIEISVKADVTIGGLPDEDLSNNKASGVLFISNQECGVVCEYNIKIIGDGIVMNSAPPEFSFECSTDCTQFVKPGSPDEIFFEANIGSIIGGHANCEEFDVLNSGTAICEILLFSDDVTILAIFTPISDTLAQLALALSEENITSLQMALFHLEKERLEAAHATILATIQHVGVLERKGVLSPEEAAAHIGVLEDARSALPVGPTSAQ